MGTLQRCNELSAAAHSAPMHLPTSAYEWRGPEKLFQSRWPSSQLGKLRLLSTVAASLPKVVNSCTSTTRSNPTNSEWPPRITTPYQLLFRKAIQELHHRIPPTEVPGRQAFLRSDQTLGRLTPPHPRPPAHPPAPLIPPSHPFPRTKLPLRLEPSTNLPTSPNTSTHSFLTQHHRVGIRTLHQSSKS